MTFTRRSVARSLALAFSWFAAVSCGDKGVEPPVLTTITVTVKASLVPGQTDTAKVSAEDQRGDSIAAGTVTFATLSASVATVSATGVVTAVGVGTTKLTATMGTKSDDVDVVVVASPALKINEVESNGGTPGDWVEIYNPTANAVDISGWGFRDNDATHTVYKVPAGTTLAAGAYYMMEEAQFVFGLGAAESAILYNQFGVVVDSTAWLAHSATTLSRCPNGSGPFVVSTSSTKNAVNDCSFAVKINEVESNGGTPGDWVELYNISSSAISLAGYGIKDNDDTHAAYVFPAGTTIAAGGYLVVDEATFVFGLGAADNVRLYDAANALVETYSWATHATITYGRCPDGTGAFASTTASTKGTANTCSAPVSVWPGADDAVEVDGLNVFQTNLSGLTYEGGATPVLWAARNGPGTLFRLIFSGGIWTPDPANGWSAGKALKYTDGLGNPDTEGVTFASGGSAGGMYVATERNNDASTVSRNSILRVDPSGSTTSLTATNDWNITADLPVVGANLGIEALTWIPDSMLVARGFRDSSASKTYVPADYANHGSGLFFAGLEANGNIYVYALNHSNNTFTRITTIVTGYAGVMGLEYDRETGYLWATCDDGCGNTHGILEIDTVSASATKGRFKAPRLYAKPASLANLNNEGFAIVPNADCVAGKKYVFWSDDGETGGHSIRRASVNCGAIP